MAGIEVPEVFEPLFKPARYKVFYGGRGAAKSWNFARALLALAARKPLLVLCAREFQSSIKESVYLLLKQQIPLMELSAHFEILSSEIRGINGSRFIFEGLKQNVERIKSLEGVDICWVEEADKVTKASWDILIPTIRKSGSEIWVSFNPNQQHDATYQRFVVDPPEGAVVRKVSWRDNPWFTEELRAEKDRLKLLDYEDYLHVWEGELKTLAEGAIYGKQLLEARRGGRIGAVPIEQAVVVNTFWDLGRNDHNAVWFHQQVGPQHRFIDYADNRLQDIDYYARLVKGRLTDSELRELGLKDADNERRQKYLYGTHFMPHDVLAMMLGMSKSRRQQFEDAGVKPIEVVPRIDSLKEGIDRVRQVFPSCWFDEKRCRQGIAALSNYAWRVDEDNDALSRTPIHNWASNGADAFRQFAQGYVEPQDYKPLKVDTRYVV